MKVLSLSNKDPVKEFIHYRGQVELVIVRHNTAVESVHETHGRRNFSMYLYILIMSKTINEFEGF